MKSGFVSIVGRPNVGKSTLLNAIVGAKVSIVTPKAQTTNYAIEGIYNDEDSQIIFIDTPGIHKAFNSLGKELDKISFSSIRNNDVIIFVIDSSKNIDEYDKYLFEHLKIDKPLILCFNKIDLTNIIKINEIIDEYKSVYKDGSIIQICAKDEFNIKDLINLIKSKLNEGPRYYDVEEITTQNLKFYFKECVREQLLLNLDKEVPHGAAVVCDEIKNENNKTEVLISIYVEKDSQKGIIIGKGGKMIKKIGTNARKEMEKIINSHINLILNVKVEKNWRNSEKFLNKIGY